MLKLLVGLAMLAGAILYRGFYTLSENEVAVVVEYEASELIGKTLNELVRGKLENFRADLIAIIYEQHSGGKAKVVRYEDPPVLPLPTPYGRLYWHLPPPFGKHHKISLEPHDYHLTIPLINTLAVDQEDRPLMYYVLTPDVDGDPLTEDPGFRLISAHDLFEVQFSPEAELAAMMLDVKGQFRITNLENYALWVKDSYGQMDKLIEEHGFYGEMVGGPFGDELIGAYLSSILDIYVWEERYPALLQATEEKYPELPPSALESTVAKFMIENPETLTEGFVDYLASPEFVERTGVNLERGAGIDVLEKITTEMYEGTL
ncbi:MAG: hypothetical protein ACE5OW_05960 [Candidatus Bathyarchaeia archaeon]